LLKLKFFWLLTALVLLPGSVSGAEIYSIQVGVYQNIKNAENQCRALQSQIEASHLEALRIEKKGPQYAVRIGRFNQEKPARELLSRILKTLPQAFLWKGDYDPAQIVRRYGPSPPGQKKESPSGSGPSLPAVFPPSEKTGPKTPASEPAPKGRTTSPPAINTFSENTLEMGRAMLWGTILESSPLPGNPLGLTPEKEIFRVMVRVDKSEPLKGYPNFLQDKETEEIILYSEVRPPFFVPAQRIKALVEYRGDKYRRFFWIKQAEPIKP
jgi:hypothetical protein